MALIIASLYRYASREALVYRTNLGLSAKLIPPALARVVEAKGAARVVAPAFGTAPRIPESFPIEPEFPGVVDVAVPALKSFRCATELRLNTG